MRSTSEKQWIVLILRWGMNSKDGLKIGFDFKR